MQDLSINYVDKMQGLVVLVCYKKNDFYHIYVCVSVSVLRQENNLSPERVFVKFVLGVVISSVKKSKVWLKSEKDNDKFI